jgi:hypothetical protein
VTPARIPRLPSVVRLLAVFALIATSASLAHAQSPVDSSARRKQAAPAHAEGLGSPVGLELSADQRTKLSAISNRHAEEGKAASELFRTDPDAAMKRMVALRTKMQSEARAVLTTEQRAVFDRNVAAMNAQMNAHLPVAAAPR